MTPFEATEYIHSKFRKGARPGLHRIRALLQAMGDPQKQLRFVHIAGTNGKGSTAAMTASILTHAGLRTGLFTSPFIYRFHERLQIDGRQISDADLVAAVELVRPFADAMDEQPTEFELVCAVAFAYFARQRCDIVVLEVGMGGLLDATNVIDAPEVAVITNIGLDHTDALGHTPEAIAAHKAGIIKPGCTAVVYRGSEAVEQVYEQVCTGAAVPLKKADFASLHSTSCSLEGQRFDHGLYRDLFLPLLGSHQLSNAAVVLAAVEALRERGWRIPEEAVRQGLAQVRWAGRFDIVSRQPLFIIDGGHNPQCIQALERNIREYLAHRRVIALTGVLADKDYAAMYAGIMPLIHRFVCITPPSPRRLEGEVLAQHLRAYGAEAEGAQSIEAGVRRALELAGESGAVLCFGSLYTIGDIKAALDHVLGRA